MNEFKIYTCIENRNVVQICVGGKRVVKIKKIIDRIVFCIIYICLMPFYNYIYIRRRSEERTEV